MIMGTCYNLMIKTVGRRRENGLEMTEPRERIE